MVPCSLFGSHTQLYQVSFWILKKNLIFPNFQEPLSSLSLFLFLPPLLLPCLFPLFLPPSLPTFIPHPYLSHLSLPFSLSPLSLPPSLPVPLPNTRPQSAPFLLPSRPSFSSPCLLSPLSPTPCFSLFHPPPLSHPPTTLFETAAELCLSGVSTVI